MSCNFTGDTSDCSYLFDGAPLSGTLAQAVFAGFIMFTSLPVNVVLITALTIYHSSLDQSRHLVISILFSNSIVSVFLSGEVFIVSIARSWVFGYWGCQVFSFATTIGIFSRGLGGGMIALDRFCRHFFPISYPQLESRVVFGFLVNTWLIGCLIVVPFYFFKSNSFQISIPGCSFTFETFDMPMFESSILLVLLCLALIISIVIPFFLYIAAYVKIRTLRRVNPSTEIDSSNGDQLQDTQKAVRKATGIHFILLLTFTGAFLMIVGKFLIRLFLEQTNAVIKTRLAVYVLMSTVVQSYVLADSLLLLLINEMRISARKLINRMCPRITKDDDNIELEETDENREASIEETAI